MLKKLNRFDAIDDLVELDLQQAYTDKTFIVDMLNEGHTGYNTMTNHQLSIEMSHKGWGDFDIVDEDV